MSTPETKPKAAKGGRVTIGEGIAIVLFAGLLLLGKGMLEQWQEHTELLKQLVIPINNGDDVCDDFEIMTSRPIDGTPCGEFLEAVVKINSAI